ncbi:MAG: TonB family protein [Pseudomonadota bacterium]
MNNIILKQAPFPQFTFLPLVSSHHSARFVLFLFIALMLHGFIIFQISFKIPEKKIQKPLPLDIIINPVKKEQIVKKANYFAQSGQRGGGQQEIKARPINVIPGKAEKVVKAAPIAPIKQVVKNKQSKAKINNSLTAPEKVLKSQLSSEVKAKYKAAKLQPKTAKKKSTELVKIKPKPKITMQYLADLKQQIVDLEADIDLKSRVYSKRSKHKYINASTAKALDAQYIRQWTRKIERIGNLNYPAQARKKGLSGKLILAVTLDPSGEILNIVVRKSSQHKTLDDAAIRIVKLSAPFAPIPKNVLQQNTALVITRTWLFTQKSNGQISMN